MEPLSRPRIVAADRVDDGLVIKFEEDRCFFFSAALLYSLAPEAQPLDEDEVLW